MTESDGSGAARRPWVPVALAAALVAASCSDGSENGAPGSRATARRPRATVPTTTEPSCRTVPAACTLRQAAAQSDLRIGAAVDPGHLEVDAPYGPAVAREFNSLTPENAMKWPAIHPSPGRYDFADADSLVALAERSSMEVRGHTLVWGQAAGNGVPDYLSVLTEGELRAALTDHIETVMKRYRGRVARWDVVNEPLEIDGVELDDNVFRVALGDSYVAEAFRIARRADPDAELWLNEINLERIPAKADALVALVARLVDEGVPIDGVGLQTHLFGGPPDPAAFGALIRQLADLGVEVAVTELDLPAGPGPGRFERQALGYAVAVDECLDVPACREVTVWGVTDRYTWLDDLLAPGLDPLLLDIWYRPKPAYDVVRDRLAEGR